MSTPGTRAAIYARISEDVTGERAGVERQLTDARELARARGWQIIAEQADNDISALKGKHRPGYEGILRLVEAGAIDYVIVWQTSRLLRNRKERAAAIDLFGRKRVGIITVKGQDLDLSSAYGRGMAGLLGEFDTMESEVKSERVAAAAADRAKRGRPNGALGYGWELTGGALREGGKFVEHPEKAAIVREICSRLGAGESLLGVTADLNRRGIPAPHSDTWGKTSVKKIALRPSNAALRVHHSGRLTEQVFAGAWPALIARAEWEKLTALLGAPTRRTNGIARPGARKHLISWGIGECGVCGSKLRVAMRGSSTHGVKKPLYVCDSPRQCVGRDESNVDKLVRGVVCERLSRPDALDWLLGDKHEAKRAGERVAELRRRLDDAADQFADGKIDATQMTRITERLRPQIEESEATRQRHVAQIDLGLLGNMAGPKALATWDSIEVPQRRAILEALGVRVIVDKVKRRGPGFDPESVRFEWRAAQ